MSWKTSLLTPELLLRAEARMRRALDVAKRTPAGDVPVGAVPVSYTHLTLPTID